MICDDCTKKDVCRLKERCNVLERDIANSKIEDAITLEVKCKHKEKHTYTFPNPYLLPGEIKWIQKSGGSTKVTW